MLESFLLSGPPFKDGIICLISRWGYAMIQGPNPVNEVPQSWRGKWRTDFDWNELFCFN